MKQHVLTLLKARPFSCLQWMALIITSQSSSHKWCAEIVLKGEYVRLFVLCVKYVYLSLKYRSSCIVRHTFCRKYAGSKMTALLMLPPTTAYSQSILFLDQRKIKGFVFQDLYWASEEGRLNTYVLSFQISNRKFGILKLWLECVWVSVSSNSYMWLALSV